MTEKRFIVDDDGIVTDMLDLSMYIDNDDCCEKLNELHEENEQLKHDATVLICSNQEYRKENEQLKGLIKKTLETTPIEHTLAMELKNSVRELYD